MPSIPAIGQITDPTKVRVALIQGQQIVSAPATALSDAVGLPAGGSTGQVLTKSSGTDYDTAWANTGDFSGPASATDGNLVAFDGTTGKLGKDSGSKPADFATAAQGGKADTAVQPSQVRERLTANRAYYVATTGSDSNDGLTSGNAFATIQKAVNVAAALDCSVYSVTINVSVGTYAEAISLKSYVGGIGISIVGDTTTPSNVLILGAGTCFTASAVVGPWTLQGMKLSPSAGQCIAASNGSVVNFGNIDFGAVTSGTQSHITCTGGATVNVIGNYTISGGCFRHWWIESTGYLFCAGKTITLSGTPAFSSFFAYSSMNAVIQCNGNTFSGSATGTRYSANLNGVINSGGATLPGSAAGSAVSGGQYA